MRSADLERHHANPTRSRICSGGCTFFEAQYRDGRKIPGIGNCLKARDHVPVCVGTPCLWGPNIENLVTKASRRATA